MILTLAFSFQEGYQFPTPLLSGTVDPGDKLLILILPEDPLPSLLLQRPSPFLDMTLMAVLS
jgi:hypothetical protein